MFSTAKFSFQLDNENQTNRSTFCSRETSFGDPSGMYLWHQGRSGATGLQQQAVLKAWPRAVLPGQGSGGAPKRRLEMRLHPDMLKQYCVSSYLHLALDEYVLCPTQNQGNSPRDSFFCDCSKILFKRVQGSHPTSVCFLFHQHSFRGKLLG